MYYIQKYLDSRWSISMDEQYNTSYNIAHRCAIIPQSLRIFEMHLPVMPYIRESRRAKGLYALTLDDTFRTSERDARTFDDYIAIGDYEEDLHRCFDKEEEFNEDYPWPSKLRKAFEIPLRSFIPETVDGLIVSGKSLSVSRLTNGATRNQPISMLTGQAAGVVAYLSAKNGIQPRKVNSKAAQKILNAYGTVYKAHPKSKATT